MSKLNLLMSLMVGLSLTQKSGACPHNFAPDLPVTNVLLANKVRENKIDYAQITLSISGQALGEAGKNPLKLLIVDSSATVEAKELSPDTIEQMNKVVAAANNFDQMNKPMKKSTYSRGVEKNKQPQLEVIRIGNSVVTLETFTNPQIDIFSEIKAKYNFDSDHVEAMNYKLYFAMEQGFKVIVAEAKTVDSSVKEDINIGLIVKTPTETLAGKDPSQDYFDKVNVFYFLNLWITRAESGGIVMRVGDIGFNTFQRNNIASDAIFGEILAMVKNSFNDEDVYVWQSMMTSIVSSNQVELKFDDYKLRRFFYFSENLTSETYRTKAYQGNLDTDRTIMYAPSWSLIH